MGTPAPLYAFWTALRMGGFPILVEVDITRFSEDNWLPDEDYAVCRHLQAKHNLPPSQAIRTPKEEAIEAQAYVRDNLHGFRSLWQDCYGAIQVIAHSGPISRQAISKICVLEMRRSDIETAMGVVRGFLGRLPEYKSRICLDPLEQRGYHEFTRWFLGAHDCNANNIRHNSYGPDKEGRRRINRLFRSRPRILNTSEMTPKGDGIGVA